MRCPGCGSDTTPALPRCTRCNAPLDDATVHDETVVDETGGAGQADRGGEGGKADATARDWFEDKPRGGSPAQPPPTPWSPRDPSGRQVPPAPDPGVPPIPEPWGAAPPSGESTLSLSQEPWAASPSPGESTYSLSPEPWDEPAIWQPPPPRKRRGPYLLIAAGVMVLAAIALGIVFWPGGSGETAGNAGNSGTPQQSRASTGSEPAGSPSPEDPTTAATGADLAQQARAVDALLGDMEGTRADLGTVVSGGCERAALERIREQRQGQLAKARALDVGALLSGTDLKDALVRALEASVESNQRYLDAAPGCPSDSDVADANQRASDAKNEFIGLWDPNAEKAGLSTRSADAI